MDFETAYKPPKPFWAMSIPELVAYNNKCKRLDEYFLKGKPLKTPRTGGSNTKRKKKKTRNRKNRKTRRRKNKRTRRRRKLATIRSSNEHHTNQS
tara:strand:+ start:2959 stop:3243 length:285 start_codon:yes stop_codon:yes gene_type:complete